MSAMAGETLAELRATYDWRISRALARLEAALRAAALATAAYDRCRDQPGSDPIVIADLREARFLAEVKAAAGRYEYDALQDQAALDVGRPR